MSVDAVVEVDFVAHRDRLQELGFKLLPYGYVSNRPRK
jgi:hypothetical protein